MLAATSLKLSPENENEKNQSMLWNDEHQKNDI
jgi:hypothetical protein